MTPLDFLKSVPMESLSSWVVFLAAVTVTVASTKGWRVLGNMEAMAKAFGKRLDSHSGEIREHDRILVRLEDIPARLSKLHERFTEMEKEFKKSLRELNIKVGNLRE